MRLPELGSTESLQSPPHPAESKGAGGVPAGRREGFRLSCSSQEAKTFKETVLNRPKGVKRSRWTIQSEQWVVMGSWQLGREQLAAKMKGWSRAPWGNGGCEQRRIWKGWGSVPAAGATVVTALVA